jgi:hypothetical protein
MVINQGLSVYEQNSLISVNFWGLGGFNKVTLA